ncbi:MAG: HEPN domain-containing protein [Treponema sp.]|nr:HEPN domain-containing protein [Treponema sp.]
MGKVEILQKWLARGDEELRSAVYLSTMHYPTPDETICYLCQQSAEKYFKAFIFLHDIEPDKTHDLEYLLEMCQKYNANFSTLFSKAILLNRYAVLPRYPNQLEISDNDMKTAIQYAKDVQGFVLKAIEREREK